MRAYQATALGHALDEIAAELLELDNFYLEFGSLILHNREDDSKVICRWIPKDSSWDIVTSEVEDDD